MQRGRFVPHVVTISLDTEPFIETTTEEVVVGSVGSNNNATSVNNNGMMTAQQQQHEDGSNRIRTTTAGESSITTTVTKTTYNVPGRGAALGATRPHIRERRPRLGQLVSACPLDGAKASAVTCVNFSPCTYRVLFDRIRHERTARGNNNNNNNNTK